MPRSVSRLIRLSSVATALACVVATTLPAQAVPLAAPATVDECLGLTFGPWTPPLDAAAAGHRLSGRSDGSIDNRAPGARDWALRLEAGRDTTLILFPAWWPVGVAIRVPAATGAAERDTLKGTATALVADASVKAPTSAVLLWRVPCGRA